jgi:GDP-L-fucose synthase
MIRSNDKIYVAGHQGMVGSAIVKTLRLQGQSNIITRTHKELDLTNQASVKQFFEEERPNQVYLAAAKVGGIHSNNTYPAEFIYQNLMIEANIINAAWQNSVHKFLFLGSSCIYPKSVEQPMKENALLTGVLEPTNEPYAVAKIAGIKLCESYNRQYGTDYRSVMPTNLYGPNDNYHPQNSHVIPALIQRFHNAKIHNKPSVEVWGSGKPRREFLYVDDMAAASVHVMNIDNKIYEKNVQNMISHINIGSGYDITIKELVTTVSKVVDYHGNIEFNKEKSDGPPRKLMDSSRLKNLGWRPKISLEEGLKLTYSDFKKNIKLRKNE